MIGQDLFLNLMRQFLERQIDADTFCTRFVELWTQNRDIMYSKKLTWSEPRDEMLMDAFQRGEITEKQFRDQFAVLWGYGDALSLQNMIDSIHSACNVFRPAPTCSWEIDEIGLRREVAAELASYKSALTHR